MKRTRIAFVLLGAYPYFNKELGIPATGGAEADMYYIAKHLDKSLFDVHFVVSDFGQSSQEIREGVTLHRVSRGSFFPLLTAILKIQPTLIFSKGISWQTVYLIIIKWLTSKKLYIKSSHKKNIDGTLQKSLYGQFCKVFINAIDAFILQNEEDIPVFQNTFPAFVNPLLCIRNFQDVPPTNKHLPFERTLLWIGRAESFKRPELYLELATKLPAWRFIMVIPKSSASLFADVAYQTACIKNIEFYPGLTRDHIDIFCQKSAFLVSTSLNEGFPNVIIEALKNGTPVLSWRDYDDLLTNSQGGIIVSNTRQVQDILSQLTPDVWSQLSDNAYQLAKKEFSAPEGTRKYTALFLGKE